MLDLSNIDDFYTHENAIDYKKELNEKQYQAVTRINGPTLIIAGAGSGKTRTLIYRLSYMIENGIDPKQILLMTFTNKAANEMTSRAVKMLDDRCNDIESGTYHAFCSKLLRKYIKTMDIGLDNSFTILDTPDSVEAINIVKDKLGYRGNDKVFPKGKTIQAILSMSINKDLTLEEVIVQEKYIKYAEYLSAIKEIIEEYKKYKQQRNMIDYDDILVLTVKLLSEQEEIKNKLRKVYKYIMVDEYQDSNKLQFNLLKLLVDEEDSNICVVGDPDQSIYGFRGAHYMNIINFPKQFNNCEVIILDTNYRSNQEILDLSNKVTDNIKNRFDKQLIGVTHKGSKPNLVVVNTTYEEARVVYYNIVKEHFENGVPLSEIAVLIKGSNDSNELEGIIAQYADRYNIPYQKFGGIKFMERAFVKDILAFIKLSVNPLDDVSWFRLLKILPNVGPTYANKIIEGIHINGIEELKNHQKRKYGAWLPKLYNIIVNINNLSFSGLMDTIVKVYYKNLIEEIIKQKRIDDTVRVAELKELDANINNAQVLIHMAEGYNSAEKFLSDIVLDANADADKDDKLTISTVHSAKGLEFKTVYLLRCTDSVYPYNEDDIDEERRVFYVALTRAKDNLYLMYPKLVFKYGTSESQEPSRFIDMKYVDIVK